MHAVMAELADALDSGSSVSNDVEVRVLLTAPYLTNSFQPLGWNFALVR